MKQMVIAAPMKNCERRTENNDDEFINKMINDGDDDAGDGGNDEADGDSEANKKKLTTETPTQMEPTRTGLILMEMVKS